MNALGLLIPLVATFAAYLIWRRGRRRFQFGQHLEQGRLQAVNTADTEIAPLPESLLPTDKALRELGFALAFTVTVTWDAAIAEIIGSRQIAGSKSWVYRNPETFTTATVKSVDAPVDSFVNFDTSFGNGALVLIGYPYGLLAEAPTLFAAFTNESLHDAYTYHLERAAEFRQKFGEPLPFGTPQDSLDRFRDAQAKYSPVFYGQTALELAAQAWLIYGVAAFVLLTGWSIFLGGLLLPEDMPNSIRTMLVWAMPFAGLVAGFGRFIWLSRAARRSNTG